MSEPMLLDVEKDLSPRLKWKADAKEKLSIFTHHYEGMGWMAFSHSEAVELLKDYQLTDDEKTVPMALFAAYCRLLDESGILTDGQPTEFDAVIYVAKRNNFKMWNEPSNLTTRFNR